MALSFRFLDNASCVFFVLFLIAFIGTIVLAIAWAGVNDSIVICQPSYNCVVISNSSVLFDGKLAVDCYSKPDTTFTCIWSLGDTCPSYYNCKANTPNVKPYIIISIIGLTFSIIFAALSIGNNYLASKMSLTHAERLQQSYNQEVTTNA